MQCAAQRPVDAAALPLTPGVRVLRGVLAAGVRGRVRQSGTVGAVSGHGVVSVTVMLRDALACRLAARNDDLFCFRPPFRWTLRHGTRPLGSASRPRQVFGGSFGKIEAASCTRSIGA